MDNEKPILEVLSGLHNKAESLAGRRVDVDKTKDGLYIVLYLQFEQSPPPKGKTEVEALELFIKWMESKPKEIEAENTKENDNDDRDRPVTDLN